MQPQKKLRMKISVSFPQAETMKNTEQSFKEDLQDEKLMRNLNKIPPDPQSNPGLP